MRIFTDYQRLLLPEELELLGLPLYLEQKGDACVK